MNILDIYATEMKACLYKIYIEIFIQMLFIIPPMQGIQKFIKYKLISENDGDLHNEMLHSHEDNGL